MSILVVEDDFLIRTILVEELEEAGYDVIPAETGDEAVMLIDTLDRPPVMLVTDIHMPGSRNGLDVVSHARAASPDMPVIVTTGRPDALLRLGSFGGKLLVVRKPYVPNDIIGHIEAMLGT